MAIFPILKKLCGFSTDLADRAYLDSTKTAEQKLKYATFECGFFKFSGAKKTFLTKDILESALKSYIWEVFYFGIK